MTENDDVDPDATSDGLTDGDSATGLRAARTSDADRPHVSGVERQRRPYTESQVIMSAVKVIVPFVFTYGLFITFHGAGSPGGGFQGGAILASAVLMIAFAFGIEPTREWLKNSVVVGLATGGVVVFGSIGLAGIAFGGTFLEYARLPIGHPEKYGMEAVEIGGIGAIVTGVLVGLFFLLAAEFSTDDEATEGER